MSNLSDLIKARGQLVARREQLSACETALVDNELRTRNATARLREVLEGATDPDTAAVRAFRQRELGVLPEEREKLEEQRDTLTAEIDTLAAEVETLEAAEPALWTSTGVPVVLFPVRIETCFKPAASGCDLLVRIYPDDLHLDAPPGPLTDREFEAGQTYWQSVWPAIGNGGTLKQTIAEAWKALGRHIDPARIALVADATRPENAPRDLTTAPADATPRFPPRQSGESGETRAALMPDAWTVYGLQNGELLFSERGKPIPPVLPVSAMRRQSTADDETPREWLVDFDLAVKVGMALSVHLEDREPSIDQLFVLGVSGDADITATAGRVADALKSHAHRGALEFIPPRAPTNNTTDSPSAWNSGMPAAMSPDALRAGLDAAGPQNGASVARALGLDATGVLAGIPGAADDWQTSPGIMIDALWSGLTVDWDMLRRSDMNFEREQTFPKSPVDEETYAALRSDAAECVRSRGPLPAIRIRRQPYGLLPTSSLDAWVSSATGDAVGDLKARILRHLRPFWLAAAGALPRAGSGKDQDEELAGVLSQDSVSTALVWRSAVGISSASSTFPRPCRTRTILPRR